MNFNHHAGHHLATDLQPPVIDGAQQLVASKLDLRLGGGGGGGDSAPPRHGDHEEGVVAPAHWPLHHQTEGTIGVHPDRSQNILYLNTNTFSKSLPTALHGPPSCLRNPCTSVAPHQPALNVRTPEVLAKVPLAPELVLEAAQHLSDLAF